MDRKPGGEDLPLYCDAAMPVPLDKIFTYSLPETLRHRVQTGCRIIAPFGPRKLAGVVLSTHSTKPEYKTRDVLRLLDEDPALTPELIELGRWISDYYCTPIGEVFKSTLPLGGEIRSTKVASLTPAGADVAAQFMRSTGADDPYVLVLRALERRPLSLTYLLKKYAKAETAVRSLEKRGLIKVEVQVKDRDPTRARDGRLVVGPANLDALPAKATKGERWLVNFLVKNAGRHDLEPLTVERKDAEKVARKLAKAGVVNLELIRDPLGQASEVPRVDLNGDQQTAVDAITSSLSAKQFATFLLYGVTGSGKTEVYLRAIEDCLARGRSAMLLVPEIALTPAVASQFFARFGDRVAILHSAFTNMQRSEQWRRIRRGEARVAIGTRSGVFAPLDDLGLVIVDEEHESSYKQEEAPRYHGRNVAIIRARAAGATVVLGSATPSLESRYNVDAGKSTLLRMPERIQRRPMPTVITVDMRQEFLETRQNKLFSRQLVNAVDERLKAGEQAMILLNRRGFSVYVMCRSCGHRIECENCSVTLTYHKREQRLLCHYCDFAAPIPKACPACKGEYMHFQGSGSEKVEDQLRNEFPKARIARLDRDTVKGRDYYETILNGFREGSYDLLVGTQMIAKGHDIPNVTLVGVVSADVGLGVPDFRAAERTFQLLTQVAGRAGRGDKPGQVVLQTMNPEHYAVELAARQDYDAFYKRELNFRKSLRYPPFAVLATMIVRSRKLEEALELSGKLAQHLMPPLAGVRMMGPAAAPVVKLRTEYRYQFLLKSLSRKNVAATLKRAREFALAQGWPQTALVIDVDPMSLL